MLEVGTWERVRVAKQDTLLGQCILRAAAAIVNEDVAGGRDPNVPPSRRDKGRVMWKATHLGANVTAFVVEWAMALDELDVDELGLERFAGWSSLSRRTAYRRLDDFRRVWPEHDTPNELARLVLAEARRHGEQPSPRVLIAA